MMKKRVLLTTVTAGLLGLGVAHAMPSDKTGSLFDTLDNNGDNQLNAKELGNLHEVMARKRFESADLDGNGKVSKTEFTVKAKQRAVKLFGRLDSNGDDALTRDEVMAHEGKRHHGGDKARHGDHKNNGKDKNGMAGGDYHKSSGHKGMQAGAWMNKLDKNGDDKISREEWNEGMQSHAGKRDDADSKMSQDSDRSGGSDMGNESDMADDSAMSDDNDTSGGLDMADDSDMSDDSDGSDGSDMGNESDMADDSAISDNNDTSDGLDMSDDSDMADDSKMSDESN